MVAVAMARRLPNDRGPGAPVHALGGQEALQLGTKSILAKAANQ